MIMQINGTSSFGFSSSRLAGIDKTKTAKSNSIMLDNQDENGEDSKVKNLQSQINALRERIQEIGENEDMDEKTKAALRQSYQEQMTALEQQLNQRRIDARQEKFEEEQEQLKNSTADTADTSSNTSKRKYDSFEKDDPLTTAVSAFNSVDIAKIHQSAAKNKEGKANVLEREAETDTRLTQTKGVVGHETKIRAKAYSGEADENGNPGVLFEGDVDYDQLEAWDEEGIYYITAEYTSVIIGEQWIGETGEAVDAKLEEMTELRTEAEQLTDEDAKALGEANREVNGDEDEEEKTEKAAEVLGKVIVE